MFICTYACAYVHICMYVCTYIHLSCPFLPPFLHVIRLSVCLYVCSSIYTFLDTSMFTFGKQATACDRGISLASGFNICNEFVDEGGSRGSSSRMGCFRSWSAVLRKECCAGDPLKVCCCSLRLPWFPQQALLCFLRAAEVVET